MDADKHGFESADYFIPEWLSIAVSEEGRDFGGFA
jgi:hypothetical protein